MVYVSPVVELLRARPALVFWTAALAQSLLWTLVPALFYASPPGDVPLVLAVGHEWQLGSWLGPPLAHWAAELAFRLAGLTGVYALSQLCVVVALWAVFALGRAIVGAKHAAMAVLLMAGIVAFGLPTVEFGPAVVAMPLTALALLHYWRAIGEDRPRYWLALGVDFGLLLLTTYAGFVPIALVILFTIAMPRGRAQLAAPYPWAALVVTLLIVAPHLAWLRNEGAASFLAAASLPGSSVLLEWLWLVARLLLAHAGLVILVAVAGGLFADPRAEVPAIERGPLDRFAKRFVYFFALAPALAVTLTTAVGGENSFAAGFGPFVVLSGLLAIVAAGDVIRIHHQRIIGWVWLALLAGPALLTIVAIVVLPWTLGTELPVSEPATAMARFFTETFNRRTGKPLAFVIGDTRLGGLVALASPDRPSLFVDGAAERAPWIRADDVREKGAIVVWRLTDAAGQPPPAIRARFPDLVPEVPRPFERAIQGWPPLTRIGWAVIRPASAPGAAQ